MRRLFSGGFRAARFLFAEVECFTYWEAVRSLEGREAHVNSNNRTNGTRQSRPAGPHRDGRNNPVGASQALAAGAAQGSALERDKTANCFEVAKTLI